MPREEKRVRKIINTDCRRGEGRDRRRNERKRVKMRGRLEERGRLKGRQVARVEVDKCRPAERYSALDRRFQELTCGLLARLGCS
jgi:hypothetical protein